MKKRAKIIATLGPSSYDVSILTEMLHAGVDVIRINMSHGTYEEKAQAIATARQAAEVAKKEVGILLDLQGPKIRVGTLERPLDLVAGSEWLIGDEKLPCEQIEGLGNFIPTSYRQLSQDAQAGHLILFDDGRITAKVVAIEGVLVRIQVMAPGLLKSKKGINLPDMDVSATSFSEKDRNDLLFGIDQGIDFVALSFVRRAADVLELKYFLHERSVDLPVIAKIERPEAVTNLKEIIAVADGIMIARGDMGVEMGNHRVPPIQKMILKECHAAGRWAITATQMLESMMDQTMPSRAEASDVANAIWDGTDAVMLSGETALGKYPLQTVQVMSEIIVEAEKLLQRHQPLKEADLSSVTSAIALSASLVAEKTSARMIIAFSRTGNSCAQVAHFRPKVRVMGITNSLKTVRRMSILWGVEPYFYEGAIDSSPQVEDAILRYVCRFEKLAIGDRVVLTSSEGALFSQGTSNSLKVKIIKEWLMGSPELCSEMIGPSQLQAFENSAGTITYDSSLCALCHNCVKVCPHAIWQIPQGEARHVEIDLERTPQCAMDGKCAQVCLTRAIVLKGR